MSSIKDEFIKSHDLYSSGEPLEMVRDETGAQVLQAVPYQSPTLSELPQMTSAQSPYATGERDPSEIPGDIARSLGSIAKGTVAGSFGAPGDIAGLAVGIGKAIGAEEGERLDSFITGVEEMSQKYGAGAVSDILERMGGALGISLADPDDPIEQRMVSEGQLAGEFIGLAPAAKAFVKAAGKVDEFGRAAQARLDKDKGTRLMSGIDPTRARDELIAGAGQVARAVTPGQKVPTRKQDELGFYSRAQEFIDNLQQEKFTSEQVRGMMVNAGVKEDELKWTGLDDFFKENPNLTKQELMEYIDANKVRLEEITYKSDTLGEDTYASFSDPMVVDDYDEINFNHERIYDYIADGEDYELRQAMDKLGLYDDDADMHIEAFRELWAKTEGRVNNPPQEIVDELQAKYPDINMKSLGWEVDARLGEVAEEMYYETPFFEVSGVDNYEGYYIIGNDDVGYNITYQGDVVSDGSEVYSLNEAQVRVQQDAVERGLYEGNTRYMEYTQPGAENYREVLLTNPSYKGDPSFKLNEAQEARLKELGDKIQAEKERRPSQTFVRPSEALREAEAYEFEALQKQQRLSSVMENRMPSPHWQEDDVVAHARLSDRTVMGGERIDVEGGRQRIPKALYIEEIQSDWAQIGRRRGFGATEQDFSIYEARDPTTSETSFIVYTNVGNEKLGDNAPHTFIRGERQFATRKQAEEAIEYEKKMRPKRIGTPEGPLVGKTDKWTEMTMRRLIRKAADEGYDYIAWTPGEVQYDRWNEEGLETYYDKVLPKSTQKVVDKLDKKAKIKVVEINIDGEPQKTLAVPITEKLKQMAKEGQPLFAVPAAVGAGAAMQGKQENKDGNL